MTIDSSIFGYFLSAGLIVKFVMLLLFAASFMSWVFIFQRGSFLKQAALGYKTFENRFWTVDNLGQFYQEIDQKTDPQGIETIFLAGFKEFVRLQKKQGIEPDFIIAGTQRAMRAAYIHVSDELEKHLPTLATIGSTSPYVGLFGTVWGIMTAFQALGHVSQATIAMVAPGISEALVATALGLFAAIPAVIAYNRYSTHVEQLLNRYQAFQDEFVGYLYRQTQEIQQ